MPDLAEQQAALAELFTEMLLQSLRPEPPQPALPADVEHALEQLAEAMAGMNGDQRC